MPTTHIRIAVYICHKICKVTIVLLQNIRIHSFYTGATILSIWRKAENSEGPEKVCEQYVCY